MGSGVCGPSHPPEALPDQSRQSTLASLEDAAEKLKLDAATYPERRELTESYLSLCRSIVLLKADILKDQGMENKR